MLENSLYIVEAFWDSEANVWCAESANFTGLATYALDLESLRKKLDIMIPELFEANMELLENDDIPYDLVIKNIAHMNRNHCA